MSRHGRRGTQGDQDDQWGPGQRGPAEYLPPDADDPYPPGDYGQARGQWAPNPIATADTGDFPPAGSSLPPASYPRDRDGRRGEAFDWGPDPLGPDTRGHDPRGGGRAGEQPMPEPMAPDRWAPQSWEPPSWERASWDSQAGELPPLPPGPMPGPGHPSGPLPPLPESDYRWGDSPSGPLPPVAPRSQRPGRDQDQSRHGAAPAGPDQDGYPQGPGGYPHDPAGYAQDLAGYPDNPDAYLPDRDEPADHPGPRGRGRRRREAAPEVGRAHPGYEGYVDDPRDLDMTPDQGQEPHDYATGSWYPDDGEPHSWAADSTDGDLLPGLDPAQGSRRGDGGGHSGPARKRRRRGRRVLLVLLAVFAVFAAIVGGVGYHYYREYINPPDFPGAGTASIVTVQIKPGQTASAVGITLASKGVVASARAFSNAAKANPQGNALEPGYYHVHLHMKASLALALLLKPSSRIQSKVTIPEGFRVSQIIALLGQQTGNLKGYQQAIAHPADLGLPAFANGKPEGYLFPATYTIPPHTTPAAVLKMMVSQFSQNAQSIRLPAKAAAAQETQAAVITVASLIEAEGKRPQDFPKIAEVIYNRLNANPQIKLELDTTVLYAMSLAHKSGFNLNFASPYNTYLHAGLPPGPIDNPGNEAINAALRPAHGNFLFFLTINSRTGQTLFFSTATAFNNAVAKYGSTGGGTGSRTGSG